MKSATKIEYDYATCYGITLGYVIVKSEPYYTNVIHAVGVYDSIYHAITAPVPQKLWDRLMVKLA